MNEKILPETIKLSLVEDIFRNIDRLEVAFDIVEQHEDAEYWGEKHQGQEGIRYVILSLGEDKYLQACYHSDSYGNTERLYSLQFVQKMQETITVYK